MLFAKFLKLAYARGGKMTCKDKRVAEYYETQRGPSDAQLNLSGNQQRVRTGDGGRYETKNEMG